VATFLGNHVGIAVHFIEPTNILGLVLGGSGYDLHLEQAHGKDLPCGVGGLPGRVDIHLA
jgi:hypothetical protein